MAATTLSSLPEETETMVPENQPSGKDGESADSLCGIGACKPRWLQRFATIQSFVGFSAVSNLTTLAVKMYLMSQVTTLERRFGFSSSTSGFILSSSQIGFILCVLFVSHAGRNAHIPRILSIGAVIIGLTGLVFAGAHLLPFNSSDTTRYSNQTITDVGNSSVAKDLCHLNTENVDQFKSNCNGKSDDFSDSGVVAMAIFVVAMLIQGAASAPRAPLGGTYVDDNNPVPTKSGKYVGIMVGIFTLAPVFSFGMGALSSRLYHTLQPTDLTPRDPRWIGAWWLGFAVLGTITSLWAIFVFCFPKRLPSARSKNETQSSSKAEMSKPHGCGNLKRHLIGPFSGSIRLLRNRIFTCIALCGTFQTCAFLGMASFTTKYIETQFYVPAYKTNLMMGAMSLLGSSLGPVCGGFVTSRYKLSLSGNIHLILVVSILMTVACPIGMLVGGQQTHVIKHDLPGESKAIINGCVSECLCQDDMFRPICGSDDATYFSPCHAGCFSRENETYTNCACSNGTATSGYCAQEDSKVYAMLLFLTLNSFALTFTLSPTYMVFVRSVSEEDKALALGLSSFMTTVLGHFPGPILYGYLVDSACILWRNSCSGRGACDLYNIEDFRLRMFGTNMALFFLAAFLVFVALLVHKFQKSSALQKENELIKKMAAEEKL